jgi:hypothetical protein
MRTAGHAACMGKMWNINVTFQPENLKGRDHLINLGVDG